MGTVSILGGYGGILDTDTVTFIPEAEILDDENNPVRRAIGTPITVTGTMQPVTLAESAAIGQQVTSLWRFITAAQVPAGAFARAQWGDRNWDVIGEPERIGPGPAGALSAHTSFLLRSRGPEPIGAS